MLSEQNCQLLMGNTYHARQAVSMNKSTLLICRISLSCPIERTKATEYLVLLRPLGISAFRYFICMIGSIGRGRAPELVGRRGGWVENQEKTSTTVDDANTLELTVNFTTSRIVFSSPLPLPSTSECQMALLFIGQSKRGMSRREEEEALVNTCTRSSSPPV
jgi:hypothetical protein